MALESRRDIADKVLGYVGTYLEGAGWVLDEQWLFRIDPLTNTLYPADVAFCIQIARDLNLKQRFNI